MGSRAPGGVATSATEWKISGLKVMQRDVPGHFIHVILGRDPSGVWAVA